MKKYRMPILICVCILVVLLALNFVFMKKDKPNTLPDINSFSDTQLEERENILPELDRAILYIDGEKSEISINDERLIRLLNFSTYAKDEGMSMGTLGIDYNDYEKEIENGNRLEVFFKNVESVNGEWDFIMYDRFVIKGNSVWMLQSDPQYELFYPENTVGATLFLPYSGICEGSENLDLLFEAGFTK